MMREFMSYILQSFQDATGWNRDNVYSELNNTSNGTYISSSNGDLNPAVL